MITIAQCRAARGLLGWTQQDLANACGLSKTAINNFEKGYSDIKSESLKAIKLAFESADVEFLIEDGLRKKAEKSRILKGQTALLDLFDDIGESLRPGEELLISHMDERLSERVSAQKMQDHRQLMKAKNITERALCIEGSKPASSHSVYRLLPAKTKHHGLMTFIYGQKVALEIGAPSMFVIIDSREASSAARMRFEQLWLSAAPANTEQKKSLES